MGVKQRSWEQLQRFQKKKKKGGGKKKKKAGSASSLPGCWEVPGEKRGREGHLGAEKASPLAFLQRGEEGEEGGGRA